MLLNYTGWRRRYPLPFLRVLKKWPMSHPVVAVVVAVVVVAVCGSRSCSRVVVVAVVAVVVVAVCGSRSCSRSCSHPAQFLENSGSP